jgi:hypothetical protein
VEAAKDAIQRAEEAERRRAWGIEDTAGDAAPADVTALERDLAEARTALRERDAELAALRAAQPQGQPQDHHQQQQQQQGLADIMGGPSPLVHSSSSSLSSSSLTSLTPAAKAAADELDIMHFASVQAQRDQEMRDARLRIRELAKDLADSEATLRLFQEQAAALKVRINELERSEKRDGLNMDYLKNVVFAYATSDVDDTAKRGPLVLALGRLLEFSEEEVAKIREKDRAAEAARGGILGSFFG